MKVILTAFAGRKQVGPDCPASAPCPSNDTRNHPIKPLLLLIGQLKTIFAASFGNIFHLPVRLSQREGKEIETAEQTQFNSNQEQKLPSLLFIRVSLYILFRSIRIVYVIRNITQNQPLSAIRLFLVYDRHAHRTTRVPPKKSKTDAQNGLTA